MALEWAPGQERQGSEPEQEPAAPGQEREQAQEQLPAPKQGRESGPPGSERELPVQVVG